MFNINFTEELAKRHRKKYGTDADQVDTDMVANLLAGFGMFLFLIFKFFSLFADKLFQLITWSCGEFR